MERGLFDALFLADELAPYNSFEDSSDATVRYAVQAVSLCCELWDSWQPDAIVADRVTGIYAHPEKIAEVNSIGKQFRCRAQHFVSPSPQGRPVLWQAGSSDDGRQFAAETAEAIFAIPPTVTAMRDYSADIRQRIAAAGRDPESVELYYGVQPIVGLTEAEAGEKADYLAALPRPEASLAMLSGQLAVDFSKFDPSTPLEHIAVPGIQGVKDALVASGAGEAVTVAEAADIYSSRFSMPPVIGTASEVADQLEHYLDDGGADGFMMLATYTPGCFEEFVIRELQRRGRYRTRYPGTTPRENIRGD
jgi:alkanesulfonate monooxygenase SsuD/methylene tetrahydromethanopterin reductase-like flavin-dependent oxidoreductase (luciferase family)